MRALSDGSTSVLTAAITCATAGIIVGVVTLTGLGQKFADIVIGYAGGSLLLTAIYTALVVWIIGLAVPVTASYIICAVIAAPAMIKLGVPAIAAHMFIFYYSVLSEVSPPTALSPFAAAAITGGDPYKTTLQAWKYTLPAFLVPFVFVLDPQGIGLLLQVPKNGSWIDIVLITVKTGLGLAALASAAQGWALRKTTLAERLLLLLAGPADDVPGLARSAGGSHHRPRHRLHRDIWHPDRRSGVDKTVDVAGAAGGTSDQPTLGRNNDHGMEPDIAYLDHRAGAGAHSRYAGARRRAEHEYRDRHRRHRRRLLSARRRHGERAVEIRARRAGDGARDRRLGRQSPAHPFRPERGRAGDGRRRARCAQGRRQVQGRRRSRCAR